MQTGIIKNLSNQNNLKNYITEIKKYLEDGSEIDPSAIFSYFNFLKNQHDYYEQNLSEVIQNINNYSNQIQNLEYQIKKNELAIQILEKLKKIKIDSNKNFILKTINTALRDIFQDDIEIDLEQTNVRGKISYKISLRQAGIEIGSNDQLLFTNGGGVLSVISVLFKILIGYLYSKNRFFIFDESFSQVSPEYRERLSLFLRKFAEKYGFTIVIVSQTSDLNTYAHVLYKVNYKYQTVKIKKEEKLIKELFIEEKTKNMNGATINEYFYVDIENFQSIKKIHFDYKGLTIISGPNNCGKSASLRAVKSILFNDFNEKYLRIGSKEAKIIFGKKITENGSEIDHNIKLIYKSKKVMFEIDGEQYLGKNLASNILKKKIEEIGFKYIDIKKLYKNIKGDLRKQVENIAYASQYDSLFLIGSKSNDIEKVFNFLFNTEKITAIIVEYKEKILELKKEIDYINNFLIQEKNKEKDYLIYLEILNNFIQLLKVKIYKILKQELDQKLITIKQLETKNKYIQDLNLKYLFISNTYNQLIKFKTIKQQMITNQNLTNQFIKKGSKIDRFLKSKPNINLINQIEKYKKIISDLDQKLITIKQLENKSSNVIKYQEKINKIEIDTIQKLISSKTKMQQIYYSLDIIESEINSKKQELADIESKLNDYHLETCPYCQGTGVLIKQLN